MKLNRPLQQILVLLGSGSTQMLKKLGVAYQLKGNRDGAQIVGFVTILSTLVEKNRLVTNDGTTTSGLAH